MVWICSLVSFMWFCPSENFLSQADFSGHLQFFSHLDIALAAPEQVCPVLKGDKRLEFQATAHLVHDERLEKIGQIEGEMFKSKISTCYNECTCGALLTLEDKVAGLPNLQSQTLRERQEQLTQEYYESCQEKIQLDCETPLVKEIYKKTGL